MTDAVSECMHQANKPEIIPNHRFPQEMLVLDSRISVHGGPKFGPLPPPSRDTVTVTAYACRHKFGPLVFFYES